MQHVAFKSLESIRDEIRRLPNPFAEAKTGNYTGGQADGLVSEDLVALGSLLHLTTRELRELFKEYFNLSIPCCLAMYNYNYESPMDAYKYKQYLRTLLQPIIHYIPITFNPRVML